MKLRINWAKVEWLKEHDPAQYREVVETLEEIDRLRESNPLQFFEPHPKQAEFMASRDRVKAFLGGNRSGKTTAGVVDDLIQAVDVECLPEHLRPFKQYEPPFMCRVHLPDFKRAFDGIIEALQAWVPKDQLIGGSWDKAYDKKRDVLLFRNGSKFEFTTHQQDLAQLGSVKRHRVHSDEEPPEDQRKENKARLADHEGDELFTMTPLNGMTWMFDEVYERRDEPGRLVVEVDIDDNPHITEAGKAILLDGLSPEEKQARKQGKFVAFGGMVLKGFSERHVVPPIEPSHLRGQTVMVGIDPGIVRGAVVWTAFDKDGRLLVFDELYPQNLDVVQVAELIKERNKFWGVEPDYVIDPSGRNRTMTGTVADEFLQEGIAAAPGLNGRRAGILQLRRRLTADPAFLMVTENCRAWLWEARRWRVEEDEDHGSPDGSPAQRKDRPKSDETGDTFKTAGPDHLMDVTRYVAMMRWFGPEDDKPKKRPSFTPDYEGPYVPDRPEVESGPFGVLA